MFEVQQNNALICIIGSMMQITFSHHGKEGIVLNTQAIPMPMGMRIIRLLYSMLLRAVALFECESASAKLTVCESPAAMRAENALKQYGNALLRLAFSYLHNIQDAEDALQDALIQYTRKAPEFENEAHEKAWLISVTSNICKNKLRHTKRLREDELSEFIPDEREADDLSFVWQCVKSLPEKYSEVLHLFYYEGYSTAEIAGMLSKNESTVRSLLMRGRSMMKATLEDIYGYEE